MNKQIGIEKAAETYAHLYLPVRAAYANRITLEIVIAYMEKSMISRIFARACMVKYCDPCSAKKTETRASFTAYSPLS